MRKGRSDQQNVQPNTTEACLDIVDVSKQIGHGPYVPFDEGSRQQLLVFVATNVKGWLVSQTTNVSRDVFAVSAPMYISRDFSTGLR